MTKYGIMVVFFIVMSESAMKLCVICTALLAIIIFGCNRTVVVRFSWYQPCNLVVYVTNVMSCVKLFTCLRKCQFSVLFNNACFTISMSNLSYFHVVLLYRFCFFMQFCISLFSTI